MSPGKQFSFTSQFSKIISCEWVVKIAAASGLQSAMCNQGQRFRIMTHWLLCLGVCHFVLSEREEDEGVYTETERYVETFPL